MPSAQHGSLSCKGSMEPAREEETRVPMKKLKMGEVDFSTLSKDVWSIFFAFLHARQILKIREVSRRCKLLVDNNTLFWRSFNIPIEQGFDLRQSVIRHFAKKYVEVYRSSRKADMKEITSIKGKIERRDRKIDETVLEKKKLEHTLALLKECKAENDEEIASTNKRMKLI